MAGLSLREAAQQAGTSKSTILRAIQTGRLSAGRTVEGGYSIDPAELFRVYPPKAAAGEADNGADRVAHRSAGQDAPDDARSAPGGGPDATAVVVRNVQLEAEISGLKALLDAEKRRADEIRQDRDRWHAQAERLALPAPERRGLFSWLRRA